MRLTGYRSFKVNVCQPRISAKVLQRFSPRKMALRLLTTTKELLTGEGPLRTKNTQKTENAKNILANLDNLPQNFENEQVLKFLSRKFCEFSQNVLLSLVLEGGLVAPCGDIEYSSWMHWRDCPEPFISLHNSG